MFGYVAPVLGMLTEEQKARYRSYYCGVCHALRDRYGSLTRVSLSNDMTFLALLLSSLYEPEGTEESARCAVHPAKKHPYRKSWAVDYAADMNALLFYYKCEDQVADDRSLRGKAGTAVYRSSLAKIRALWPLQAAGVENALTLLWEEESKATPDPDRLCNLSGEMLGSVFVPRPDDPWSSVLRSVGNGLGRFIYWMDAWEDYDSDRKQHRFNPLTVYHDRPDYEEFCRETLELLIAEASQSFEILPLERDLDLLRNVLYSDVWQRYLLKQEKNKRKEGANGE